MSATGEYRRKGSARRGRYAAPEPLPPDPRLFQHYLSAAQPSRAKVMHAGVERAEAKRIEAMRNLLSLRDNTKLTDVDLVQLDMFFNDITCEAGSSDNPEKAMNALLYGAPNRGRPCGNAHGDIVIATDVLERVRKGKAADKACKKVAVDKACEEVAKLAHLAPDSIRGIYYRMRRSHGLLLNAVVSARLLCELGTEGDDPLGHAKL